MEEDKKGSLLFKGNYLSIYDFDGYEYAHEHKCNSKVVAVLVYRNDKETPILGSFEKVPCHFDDIQLTALTGMVDDNEDEIQTAIKEVREEAGYEISKDELVKLGEINPVKFSDMTMFLFAVDVTNKERFQRTGDGLNSDKDYGEHTNYCDWVSMGDAIFSKDPTFATMIARLNAYISIRSEKENEG
jgi:8-oxo-dGTP pyrophosphatase MutT (NUDIX family)